jgi:thiol-disulfide isomerase/thioredoxin
MSLSGPNSLCWRLLVLGTVLTGCEEATPTPTAPPQRSQALLLPANGSAQKAEGNGRERAVSSQEGGQKPAKRKEALCPPREGKLRKVVSADMPIDRAAAPHGGAMSPRVPVGRGTVTWTNFWAAWCAPCKEEIPRLLAWETALTQAGLPFRLVFISLDDDERQLREFLAQESEGGLRSTYWLREGSQRKKWLTSVGMEEDPRLPVQLIVGAQGETHCVINGAVEDEDFAEVRRVVVQASRAPAGSPGRSPSPYSGSQLR